MVEQSNCTLKYAREDDLLTRLRLAVLLSPSAFGARSKRNGYTSRPPRAIRAASGRHNGTYSRRQALALSSLSIPSHQYTGSVPGVVPVFDIIDELARTISSIMHANWKACHKDEYC